MNFNNLGLCILISILGMACTADVYVPTSHQTHLLEDKGDLKITGNSGNTGTNLQIAYAFSDVFGFGIYGSLLKRTDYNTIFEVDVTEDDSQTHKYIEGALILNPFRSKNFHLEMLLSYGIGEGEQNDVTNFSGIPSTFVYGYGEYDKYSFQTNVALKVKNFAVGVSPKLSYLNFSELILRGDQEFESESTEELFWEPAYFIRAGSGVLKLEFQVGRTISVEEVGFSYGRAYYNLGIQLSFNTMKK